MDKKNQDWVKQQLEKAVNELMERGVFDELLIEAKPAWALPESLVIGQARVRGKVANFFWVLCGDAPTMCVEGSVAANPRLALRHFAYTWQKNIGLDGADSAELIQKAEALFQLSEIDDLWSDSIV